MNPGRRAPLLWLLLPLMAGLTAGRLLEAPPRFLAVAAGPFIAAAAACAWSGRAWGRRWWPLALAPAVMLAAMGYYHLRFDRPAVWDRLPAREAELTLRVTLVFSSSTVGRRVSGLGVVTGAGRHLRELLGERLFFSYAPPPRLALPLPSSSVAVVGVLEPLPHHPAGGGFPAFLVNAGANFQLIRGRLVGQVAPATRHRVFCHAAAVRFREILGAGLEDRPALAAILRAMMLGQIQEMDPEQKGLFMRSGTLHLFAISGQQITVIALSLQSLLLLARIPRVAAAALSLVALWFYVDITGSSPSAVRAFLMCGLFLAALGLRRPGNIFAALVASAVVVLVVDPTALFGASFQMSYGIVAALLLLGAPLAEALQARWMLFTDLPTASWRWHHRWRACGWRTFLGLLGVGLATSLAGTLTGIQFFGLCTPGALPANLVLIPASSLVIGAGFLSLLFGLAGLPAGSVVFNHAGALLLAAMDGFLRRATAVPGLFVAARFHPPWLGPVAQAALLAACLAGAGWRWRRARGGYWPPFLLVAGTLAFGVRFGA